MKKLLLLCAMLLGLPACVPTTPRLQPIPINRISAVEKDIKVLISTEN